MATPDSPQANGLLCWLRCDEVSGDLLDQSRRGYAATAQGNILYQQPGKPLLGAGFGVKPTSAGPIGILQQSSDAFWSTLWCGTVSVQVWFKADMAFNAMWGTKHALAYKSSAVGDTYGWYLGVLPGGGNTLVFRVMDQATSTYTASYVETDFTQFHHYVGTFDANYVRLYRDGVQVAQTFVSGALGHDAAYLTTIAEGIQGTLDDIAVWNRALTAAEVLNLYGNPANPTTVLKRRITDFYYIGGYVLSNDQLHPETVTIGPFSTNVTVLAGDEDGFNPLYTPDDQWVINGVDWTTPAWTGAPHIIAPGTVLGVLTPGQTLTIQLRQKLYYTACYGYGSIYVQALLTNAGDGLNMVLVEPVSEISLTELFNVRDHDIYDVSMNDQLLTPANLVPPPFPGIQVIADLGFVGGLDLTVDQPRGFDQSFGLYENVLQSPLPTIDSIVVNLARMITFTGSVGPSYNIPFFDLFWEVEVSTGLLTIPVSPTYQPFSLLNRLQFITTYQIPTCLHLKFHQARFVAVAPGPGASNVAVRYESPWQLLTNANFDNPCGDETPPKLPQQTWAYSPSLTPIQTLTPAGTLLAIKTMFDNWSDSDWAVDYFVVGRYLTLKRKISVGGVADTFRAMIFAGLPHQSALAGNSSSIVQPLTDALYIGTCETAGLTPPSDPALGPPWVSGWSGGVGFGSLITNLTGPPKVFGVSCDRMLTVMYYGANGWAVAILGELIINLTKPAVGLWGSMSSGLTMILPSQGMDAVLGSPLPFNGGVPCFGTIFSGGVQKRLVRAVAIAQVGEAPLYSPTLPIGYLMPIVVETGTMGGAGRELVGVLRQVRLGPYQAGRKEIRDTNSFPRAIALNGATGIIGSGLYLAQDT